MSASHAANGGLHAGKRALAAVGPPDDGSFGGASLDAADSAATRADGASEADTSSDAGEEGD